MRFLALTLSCRLLADANFPPYAGSMLRGSLGAALRRGVCMTRQKDCSTCMLAQECIFPRIFSGRQEEKLAPPFCLEAEGLPQTARADSVFSFGLKLFGYAVDYVPFFIQAFRMAGERGLGSQAARFVVHDVLQGQRSIYDAAACRLYRATVQRLPVPALLHSDGLSVVTVQLKTPLRFKTANQLSASLDFSTLCNLILRRIRALQALAGIDWRMEAGKYKEFRQGCDTVTVAENRLHWLDWTRYSSRQETAMKLGGLVGEVTFAGNMGAFSEFLRFAELVHIGKQTSFGLGQLAVSK